MKRFAFLTDLHLDEQFPLDNGVIPTENFERVLEDLRERKITEIVFGGDIGEASSHAFFFRTLNDFSISLILGNHDNYADVKPYFARGNDDNNLYYSIIDGSLHYLFLDTSADEISQNQLDWVQNECKSGKELVVFIHHPILAIDTPVDKLYPLKNRENLVEILLQHRKQVTVFCGHYHLNDERQHDTIRQITTQALSFQLLKNAPEISIDNVHFGYRIIEIHENSIETEIITFKPNPATTESN